MTATHMLGCKVGGCIATARNAGMCERHYAAQRRLGSPWTLNAPRRLIRHIEVTESCWLWKGALNHAGYGTFSMGREVYGSGLAHRVSYMMFVGPIPDGLQLDHLCRTPACVRPDHLEPVTPWENTMRSTSPSAMRARQTVCQNGHPFDIVNSSGYRQCSRCKNAARAERRRDGIGVRTHNASGYANGCRCDVCRDAAREKRAAKAGAA